MYNDFVSFFKDFYQPYTLCAHLENLVIASEGGIKPHSEDGESLGVKIHKCLQEGIFDLLKENHRHSFNGIADLKQKDAVEKFQQECEELISKNAEVSSSSKMSAKLIAHHLGSQNFAPLIAKGLRLTELSLFNPI